MIDIDQKYMHLALELAKTTLGQTGHNPCVGAVIVKDNAVIATGVHVKPGLPHAEIQALDSAKVDVTGATLYVTLEPCCHTNKITPPCTDTIIKSGITKVIIATLDQNPKVSGHGVEILRKAQIEVVVGVLENQAIQLNKRFFHFIQTNTPYVTIKAGMSIDAKLATCKMESKWITNEETRNDSMWDRHNHDAILVGVNTIICDDPKLTARIPGNGKNPIRIILDSHLRTPLDAQVINDNGAPTWIITTKNVSADKIQQFSNKNVTVLVLDANTIEIPDILSLLGKNGISSLLVEGGYTIHNSFIHLKKINQLITYISPQLIGGENGLFQKLGFENLSQSLYGKFTQVTHLGDNLKIVIDFDGKE